MVLTDLSIQAATAILTMKIQGLSIMTGVQRIKNNKFLAAEDSKEKKPEHLGSTPLIDRLRHMQRNAMENVYISILLFIINPKAAFQYRLLKVITVARILHTMFYLKGVTPIRGAMFAAGMFANFLMMWLTWESGNKYQKILVLLLLKIQMMSPITGLYRKFVKQPIESIGEDVKVMGLDKPPSTLNPKVQRLLAAHMNDLVVIVPFITLVLLTKQAGIMSISDMTVIMNYFLIARTAHSLSVIISFPKLITFACYSASIACYFAIFFAWQLHSKFNYTRKTHLLVALITKVIIVGIYQQIILLGSGGPTDEELASPEKFKKSENTRIANCLRNDCENVVSTVLLILAIRFVNIPHQLILVYAVCRIAHTVVYLGHFPQPSRALSWLIGVVFAFRIAMLGF